MKKLLVLLIVLATIFTGCRYKENPLFPSGSVKTRLQGTWQVVGFTSDGVDSLKYYNDSCGAKMKINFYDRDGSKLVSPTIKFVYGKKGLNGDFFFSNNKKIMFVRFFSINLQDSDIIGPLGSGKQSKWKILKLTKDVYGGDFKISTDYNGRNYRISFKK